MCKITHLHIYTFIYNFFFVTLAPNQKTLTDITRKCFWVGKNLFIVAQENKYTRFLMLQNSRNT